jgi:GxxExxY protein
MTRIFDPQTYAIIGAAMEVHSYIGCGFPEAPYGEALARELTDRAIPHRSEVRFEIIYKGLPLKTHYRADFVCYEQIIVELKALRTITSIEEVQVINYLKASALNRAVLLNFGATSLQYRRFVQGSISSA